MRFSYWVFLAIDRVSRKKHLPGSTVIQPSTLGLGNAGARSTRDCWSMESRTGESRLGAWSFLSGSNTMHSTNAVDVERSIRESTLREVCLSEIKADVTITAGDVSIRTDTLTVQQDTCEPVKHYTAHRFSCA